MTGSTVHNLTGVPHHLALADGIAYSVKQGDDRDAAELLASACGGGEADVLWSAPLPAGQPWAEAFVFAPPKPAAGADADPEAAPIVLVGGHESGQCMRGHCSPSFSAAAAFRAPGGVVPPPIPPSPPAPGPAPTPSPCAGAMANTCAKARAVSADECEVCMGEHAHKLQKTGCKEADFEAFCHTQTCDPKASPPQICKKSGQTCPQCGKARCDCPA